MKKTDILCLVGIFIGLGVALIASLIKPAFAHGAEAIGFVIYAISLGIFLYRLRNRQIEED